MFKIRKKNFIPNGTDEIVHIEDIIVPPDFVNHPPIRIKIQFALNYLKEHGIRFRLLS